MKPDNVIEARIAEEVARINKEDAGFKRAAAAALPGPLKDAFAPAQGINVGEWLVRPLYDIDFEFLAALNHPLDQMYKDSIEGKATTPAQERQLVSGKSAWQLAWIMTRPVDYTEELLAKPEGVAELNKLARKEFSRLQTKQLVALSEAIMKQVAVASSTTIGYDSEPEKGEEVAKSAENPPSALLQRTG